MDIWNDPNISGDAGNSWAGHGRNGIVTTWYDVDLPPGDPNHTATDIQSISYALGNDGSQYFKMDMLTDETLAAGNAFIAGIYFDWDWQTTNGGGTPADAPNRGDWPPAANGVPMSGIDGYLAYTYISPSTWWDTSAAWYSWEGSPSPTFVSDGSDPLGPLVAADVNPSATPPPGPLQHWELQWKLSGTDPSALPYFSPQFFNGNMIHFWGGVQMLDQSLTDEDVTPTFTNPEPASMALLALGFCAPIGMKLRRRKQAKKA